MLAKSLDVFVLLKLCAGAHVKSYASLAAELGMSASEIHAAVRRLADAGLIDPTSRSPRRGPALEYLVHGVRYAFPAKRGTLTRGLPTSCAAAPLSTEFSAEDMPPVWPDPAGNVRGYALDPLHPSVPRAAINDAKLYELLALVDAIRDGTDRERQRAVEELRKRLQVVAANAAPVRARAKAKVNVVEQVAVEEPAAEPEAETGFPTELL